MYAFVAVNLIVLCIWLRLIVGRVFIVVFDTVCGFMVRFGFVVVFYCLVLVCCVVLIAGVFVWFRFVVVCACLSIRV